MHIFIWLAILLTVVISQPLFGLEKQILYGFQDPEEIQWLPEDKALHKEKRGRFLNLIGPNNRFTDPFRQGMMKKKIRSVQIPDPIIVPCTEMECPLL